MLTTRFTGIPITRRPVDLTSAGSARSAESADGLLLVGHGSKCLAAVQEAHALAAVIARRRPDLDVQLGFLEMAMPPAGAVLDAMVERGCRHIVVQPLMLLAAGHGKSDVPAIVLEGRDRHPDVEFSFASALGVVPELLVVGQRNLDAVGGTGAPLLVIARGTSDPDANGEAARAARLLAEWTGAPDVEIGFTGVTWPSVPDALDRMRRLGHERFAVFFWFIATGKLIERARDQIAEFSASTGTEVIDAGYFGPDPALADVVSLRHGEAIAGRPRNNCDTCSFRAPWPGREDRVGQEQGHGHSHLAAEHRHAHVHVHGHEHG
ncbi:MAG: sirohydrochlorin chelatase [Actinomycetota bacterium]